MPPSGNDAPHHAHGVDDRIISSFKSDISAFTAKRPSSMKEFVGQGLTVANIQVMIAATQKRGAALEHILFAGPPGLGKTTLAHIIAHELSVSLTSTTGPLLERPGDLLA